MEEHAKAIHRLLVLPVLLLAGPTAVGGTIPVGGGCALADAVRSANDDMPYGGCPVGSGPDVLTLNADVTLNAVAEVFHGANGLPVVRGDMTIEGNGFSVERDMGAPPFRILAVTDRATLNLEQLTIRNGWATGALPSERDAEGILVWDAVAHLFDTVVAGNRADRNGGGVHAESFNDVPRAVLTLDRSTVRENTAGSRLDPVPR